MRDRSRRKIGGKTSQGTILKTISAHQDGEGEGARTKSHLCLPRVAQQTKIQVESLSRVFIIIIVVIFKSDVYLYFSLYCGRGGRGAMIPAKMTSKPPDLQNDLQAPRNRLPPSLTSPSLPPFSLHAPHFGLRLKLLFFVYLLWLNQTKFKIYLFIVDSTIV